MYESGIKNQEMDGSGIRINENSRRRKCDMISIYKGIDLMTILLLQRTAVATTFVRIRCIITG